MDKKRSFDEIDVIAEGGAETIASLERRIDRRFGKGVDVETPQTKSEDVESQLQAFNAILYFFAAMALFVGGFLIFNSFNMTVLQRTREIGMLRTLGTPRRKITGSVLREAALLGVLGAVLGLGLGFALAYALAEFVRALDFPVGRLDVRMVGAGGGGRHRARDGRPRRLSPRAPGRQDVADPRRPGLG